MTTLVQFVTYNFLPSLLAGGAVLLLVLAGLRVFRITHGPLRLCLLTAPLIKSTLVLLGVQPVIASIQTARDWQAAAVSPAVALPVFVAAIVLTAAGHLLLQHREHRRLRHLAVPAADTVPQLERTLDRVLGAYRDRDDQDSVPCPPQLARRPLLLVTDRPLDSPVAFGFATPIIVFPRGLVAALEESEIEGALAHEVAHFRLKRPPWCSTAAARVLTAVNPLAVALASYLHVEEEKACDQAAVSALGGPAAYAGMLIKSFRHARRQSSWPVVQAYGARLLGRRPMLTERVEHVLGMAGRGPALRWQYAATAAIWCGTVIVFMTA